ncbi:MAG: hypothetical protein IPL26_12270 [Leptospiraceae bacterium]|nr:hypothetical protein [Leptospiraceae bacterium]
MEFKVTPKIIPPLDFLRIQNGNSSISLEEILQSKTSLTAKVLEILKGNTYLLEILGKQVKLQSETRLIQGETLKLNVNRVANQVHLEVINRSNSTSEIFKQEDLWSKNYFSPLKLVNKSLEPLQSEVSIQKLIQLLEVFFPGIEWNQDTQYFSWNFKEGEANAFFGRFADSFGFYFQFSSKNLGDVNSYFHWKNEDLSDLVLHSVFHSLSSYLLANENLPELKKMLSSNSIPANNIIFHYSSIHSRGNWIA